MYIPINNPHSGDKNISSFDEDEAGVPSKTTNGEIMNRQ